MLDNLSGDIDAMRIDDWGNVWVRSTGLYSGGESTGHWFAAGDRWEPDLLAEIKAELSQSRS